MIVKKQFEPSLPPISQVIQLQSFMILKPSKRQGSIKKERGLFPSWKTKTLCFLFVPDQKLICEISSNSGVEVQETLNLATAKISKKYSEVDDRICFGVVTPNDQKYLITLKSSRECVMIFNEILSAKKILSMSMFRSYRLIQQKQPSNKQQWQKNKQKELAAVQSRKRIQGEPSSNLEGSPTKKLQLKSSLKINSYDSEFSKTNTLFQNIYKEENEMIEQCMSLEHFKGFELLKEFEHGSLYQNSQRMTKGKIIIYSPESAKQLFTLFYQFDLWNEEVKKLKKLSRLSSGVYKFYLQFHKNECFSSSKCCEVLLSLSKWDSEYYLTMNTTVERPQYIDSKSWVSFSLCAKIKCKVNNPREKEVYVCLSSAQNNDIVMKFGEELKSFPQMIKSKAKIPIRELQIRNAYDL